MSADPPRRKVAAQIPLTSTSTSTPTSQPRARAKVDPSSISTPTQSRPSLRATPSSASLVSRGSASRPFSPSAQSSVSHITRRATTDGDDARSTAVTPGAKSSPHPSMPTRSMSTPGQSGSPVIRARATPTQASRPSTPVILPRASGAKAATPTVATQSSERTRARVKLPTSGLGTPTAQPRSRSPLPSSSLASPPLNSRSTPMQPSLSAGPSLVRPSSFQTSPGKQVSALPAYLQQPATHAPFANASCPPSPHLDQPRVPGPSHRKLPPNPSAALNGLYANLPTSPGLKTIDLPQMTPRRGSEISDVSSLSRNNSVVGSVLGISAVSNYDSRRDEQSGSDMGILLSLNMNPNEDGDRWSGTTAVESSNGEVLDKTEPTHTTHGGTQRHLPETTEEDEVEAEILGEDEDAEEAKINRKVADLEISNASLMAINRSLEATKAKQRTEIIKLRRALRESRDAPSLHLASAHSFAKPLPSPVPLQSPTAEETDQGLYADYLSDEMDDPELEDRWDKIQDLVLTMQRRGEGAVQKGFEEERVMTRVLDWTEVEGDGGGSLGGTPVKGGGEVFTPGRGSPTGN